MIVGLCGFAGSGKGTVAEYLNYKPMSFASKLKDTAAILFDWPRNLLEGDTKESREWRETPDIFWSKETGKEFTPRLALQLLGTEAIRKGIYEDFWVSIVKKKLQDTTVNCVISDVRFPNEIEMLQSLGADIYWVKRGLNPKWYGDAYAQNKLSLLGENTIKNMESLYPTIHPSEYAWIGTEFTDIVYNDGSLDDLRKEVDLKIFSRYTNTIN